MNAYSRSKSPYRNAGRPATAASGYPTLSFSSTRTKARAPSPSALLSAHTTILQLRSDIAELQQSDLLIKTKIRTYQRRLSACKQQHSKLAALKSVTASSSSAALSASSSASTSSLIASLLSQKRELQQSVVTLSSLSLTHHSVAAEVAAEQQSLLQLTSEHSNLRGLLLTANREEKEETQRQRRRLQQLQAEVDGLHSTGQQMRDEVVKLEDYTEQETAKTQQLRSMIKDCHA